MGFDFEENHLFCMSVKMHCFFFYIFRQRPFSSTGGKITSFKSDLDVAKFIKFGQAQKIVVCAGAGISTASGIPDFRYSSFCLQSPCIKLIERKM